MDISVLILTHNEEKNIEDCLASVLKQKPDGDWEIIVVDGKSQDNTINIINKTKKNSDRLRLITNDKKQIAAGRNLGIQASRYPFVAFTDADCVVPQNWLKILSAEYQRLSFADPQIAGVGGGNIPADSSSRFSRALAVYLDSFLGSFNSVQGRNFEQVKQVASLACLNVLYKKKMLIECGLFDERLGNVVEDADINFRLKEKGHSLYFVPHLAVSHKMPLSFMGWLGKMNFYGRGRAQFLCKHNDYHNLFFALPLFFVLSMLVWPLGFLCPVFFFTLLYFPFIFLYAGSVALRKNKFLLFPLILAIFIATHFVYAFSLVTKFMQIKLTRFFVNESFID